MKRSVQGTQRALLFPLRDPRKRAGLLLQIDPGNHWPRFDTAERRVSRASREAVVGAWVRCFEVPQPESPLCSECWFDHRSSLKSPQVRLLAKGVTWDAVLATCGHLNLVMVESSQ